MKVKATTDLTKYGFQKDQYGLWFIPIEGLSGKGNDKKNNVQVIICIFDDREICMNVNNDHVRATYDDPVDVAFEFSMEETFQIPDVILKLIKDDQIEPNPQEA
jgi:hypothetical protein